MLYENIEKIREYLNEVQRAREQGIKGAIKLSTAKNYAQFVDKYLSWIDSEELDSLITLERKGAIAKSIDDWLYQIDSQTVNPTKATTKAVAGMAVKNWFKRMYRIYINYKLIDHCWRVLKIRKIDFNPDVFSREDQRRVMENLSVAGHDEKGFPEMVIIAWNCIARRSEVVQLKRDNVDLDVPQVEIEGVKGSANYRFNSSDPVSDELWDAVNGRYEIAERMNSKYLFPSGGSHIAPTTFSTWFGRDLCMRLFGRWRSIHGFARHTRITELFEEGFDATRIQELARHKHLETTRRYDQRHILRKLRS